MPRSRRRRANAPARLHAARRRIGAEGAPVSPPELEAVIEADRRYFLRFPGRSHRMRLMAAAETEVLHRAGGRLADPAEGMRWFTVVARVPGGRMRRWCQLPADMDQDAPEAVCADLFRALCGERDTVTESCVTFFGVPHA